MAPDWYEWRALSLIVLTAVLVAAPSCTLAGPSVSDCMRRWNAQGNAESQAAVVAAGFTRAMVFGWSGGEGGDYCFATVFTREGEPWATYALWLDAPSPGPQFGRNTTGSRYGTGELGAERPVAANAVVESDGTLTGSRASGGRLSRPFSGWMSLSSQDDTRPARPPPCCAVRSVQ